MTQIDIAGFEAMFASHKKITRDLSSHVDISVTIATLLLHYHFSNMQRPHVCYPTICHPRPQPHVFTRTVTLVLTSCIPHVVHSVTTCSPQDPHVYSSLLPHVNLMFLSI